MLQWWPRSLHTTTVVAQDLAFLAEMLRVLLALVRYVQAVRLLQGSLQRRGGRGRGEGKRICSYREFSQCFGIPPFACLQTFVSQRLK